MYCRYCGSELKPGAKLCTSCGKKVESLEKTEETKTEVAAEGAEKKLTERKETEPKKMEQKRAEQPKSFASTPSEEKKTEGGKSRKGFLLIPLFLLLAGLGVVLGIRIGSGFSSGGSSIKQNDPFAKRDIQERGKAAGTESSESDTDSESAKSSAESGNEGIKREEKLVLAAENTELGTLQRKIAELDSMVAVAQRIDLLAASHVVGTRNPSESWNSDVFYTPEGYESCPGHVNKNFCRPEQKQLINTVTENRIDYIIYIDPNDGVMNKIAAIEYLVSGGLQVTEYYYDANRMPRLVYQYDTDNYVAGYTAPEKPGQRLLFDNDALLIWQEVRDGSSKWNRVANVTEAEWLRKSWPANTISLYQSESADMRRAFDERESIMLNAAYSTYETVMNVRNLMSVSGYAYDEQGNGIAAAVARLYRNEDGRLFYESQTDADGKYQIYVPSKARQYMLQTAKQPYQAREVYGIGVENDQPVVYQTPVYLLECGGAAINYHLKLGGAPHYNEGRSDMQTVIASAINLREGINSRMGTIIVIAKADESGEADVQLKPGVYMVELIASGYETVYDTLVTRQNGETRWEFFMAPTVGSGQVSIASTWDAVPADLDPHPFTQRGAEILHAWFGSKEDSLNNDLDVDDMSSYGSETVTIKQFSVEDYYKYCIFDFTNGVWENTQSYEFLSSGATVQVYTDQGLAAIYHVPTNRPGVVWEIFGIRSGRITPIQRYYNYVSSQDWWMHG